MTSISDLVCKQFNVKCDCDVEHSKKYTFLVNFLGYEQVKKCIPFTIAEIKNALAEDEHLNNLTLEKWDCAAGFRQSGWNMYRVYAPLIDLYKNKHITCFSCAEGVCILKECARMWAEEA